MDCDHTKYRKLAQGQVIANDPISSTWAFGACVACGSLAITVTPPNGIVMFLGQDIPKNWVSVEFVL